MPTLAESGYIRRAVLCLALTLASGSSAQTLAPQGLGKVVVRIREAGGVRVTSPAWVRLSASESAFEHTSDAREDAQVIFENVPLGEYRVEVRAPGYLLAVNEASLLMADAIAYVNVDLRPENQPKQLADSVLQPGPPVMPPKARKEFQLAETALREKNLKKAQGHLDRAKKNAPDHPDFHYLQGLIDFEQQAPARAQPELETALRLQPSHTAALAALGAVLYSLGKFADAVVVLEKSVELSPENWQSHRALAMCQLQLQAYEKAEAHTERALELAGDLAPDLYVLRARILIAFKENDKAGTEFQSFIAAHPSLPEVADAQRLLIEMQGDITGKDAGKPGNRPGSTANTGLRGNPALAIVPVAAPMLESRSRPEHWAPPAVNSSPPQLLNNTSCPLRSVLAGAGKRAVALVENLQNITATEAVEQAELDNDGNQVQIWASSFEYLVSITEPRPGYVDVEESRRALQQGAGHPRFLTNGLSALALVFHPYYVKDFEMRCEGLAEIQGQAAWSMYFKQRADKPSRMRSYRTQEGHFDIPLQGRAWIAANNFQVLRLETDLVAPVKKLQLEQEHLVIEYQPVDFKSRNVRLWLPEKAQMYAYFRGRRYHFQHGFADYLVFSVDVNHKTLGEKKP